MSAKYTIGLDYGTNSVRALIVNVANGAEVGRRRVDLRARHAGRDFVPRPEPCAAASARLRQRRGDHHQAGARHGEEIRESFQVPTKSSASVWTRPAARRCPWMPTASRWRSAKNLRTIRRRWRGCGRTIPASPRRRKSPRSRRKSVRNFSPSAAAFIRANGFSARF